MKRKLMRVTIVVEKDALDFFRSHLIKLSSFVQQKMREVLPIYVQQKLEKETDGKPADA